MLASGRFLVFCVKKNSLGPASCNKKRFGELRFTKILYLRKIRAIKTS